jgi:hypothetical protein
MPDMDAENWFRMDHSTSQLSSPTLASLFTRGPPLAPTSDGLPKVVDPTFPTAFKVVLGKARPRSESKRLEQLPHGDTRLGMKRTQELNGVSLDRHMRGPRRKAGPANQPWPMRTMGLRPPAPGRSTSNGAHFLISALDPQWYFFGRTLYPGRSRPAVISEPVLSDSRELLRRFRVARRGRRRWGACLYYTK